MAGTGFAHQIRRQLQPTGTALSGFRLTSSQSLLRKLCAALLVCFPVLVGAAELPFRVIVLDVGEGQSVLLQRSERGVLVDSGHLGKARLVLDRLQAHGVRQLDYLILTHLHPDHATGYFRLQEAFPAAKILDNGQHIPSDFSPDTVRWVYEALMRDPNRRVVRAGDVIEWQDVELRIVWPEEITDGGLNHNSLVVQASFIDRSILVMGDADKAAEQRLMKKQNLPSPVDLLVVGHHGSARASGAEFLERIAPTLAVISINSANVRGYPDKQTIERLTRHSDKLLMTYRDGEVCIEWKTGSRKTYPCKPTTD